MRIETMGTDDGKTRFVDTKTGDVIEFPGGNYSYLTFCYPNPKEGDPVEIEKKDDCLYVHKANNENSSRMSFVECPLKMREKQKEDFFIETHGSLH